MSKVEELKTEIERLPKRSSPNLSGGCQKRTGNGGTRRSKVTLKLESSFF